MSRCGQRHLPISRTGKRKQRTNFKEIFTVCCVWLLREYIHDVRGFGNNLPRINREVRPEIRLSSISNAVSEQFFPFENFLFLIAKNSLSDYHGT